jgi:hypothetical protein
MQLGSVNHLSMKEGRLFCFVEFLKTWWLGLSFFFLNLRFVGSSNKTKYQ